MQKGASPDPSTKNSHSGLLVGRSIMWRIQVGDEIDLTWSTYIRYRKKFPISR